MGDLGVIFVGQDKGHGPKLANPLSAHRFFWPTKYSWWDTESAGFPMPPEKNAGPRPQKGHF